MVPGLYGGSNGGDEYNASSKFVEKFSELGVPEDQAIQYENGSSYWGDQPLNLRPGLPGRYYLPSCLFSEWCI